MFCSISFVVFAFYVWICNLSQMNFYARCKAGFNFFLIHFSNARQFFEKAFLLPYRCPDAFLENQLAMDLFLNSLCFPFNLFVYHNANIALYYYNFIVSLEIRQYEFFDFVLPFSSYFSCSKSFEWSHPFQNQTANFYQKKKFVKMLDRMLLNLQINLRRMDNIMLLSLPIHKNGIFLDLFRFSLNFLSNDMQTSLAVLHKLCCFC